GRIRLVDIRLRRYVDSKQNLGATLIGASESSEPAPEFFELGVRGGFSEKQSVSRVASSLSNALKRASIFKAVNVDHVVVAHAVYIERHVLKTSFPHSERCRP